jgi:hypothetical protein
VVVGVDVMKAYNGRGDTAPISALDTGTVAKEKGVK